MYLCPLVAASEYHMLTSLNMNVRICNIRIKHCWHPFNYRVKLACDRHGLLLLRRVQRDLQDFPAQRVRHREFRLIFGAPAKIAGNFNYLQVGFFCDL